MPANPPRLGVIMDPIGKIKPAKDTSLAMLLEAQRRGWDIRYLEQADLYLRDGAAHASMCPLEVRDDPAHWYTLGEAEDRPLASLDVILMRKDPPFDMEYVYTTYILERAEAAGVMVVNRPGSLREVNEKAYTAWFPECCPPTLIARDMGRIRRFIAEQGRAVIKPLDGMGGQSIFVLGPDDANLSVAIETLTEQGGRQIMAQRYLPEIRDGDKRILLIDGEPIPYALARIPAPGESRGNLAAGGRGEGRPLTERDRWIAAQVGPSLREKGLVFVGLDVIGDYLTEINVTSPTCVRELDAIFDINIAGTLFDALARRLQ